MKGKVRKMILALSVSPILLALTAFLPFAGEAGESGAKRSFPTVHVSAMLAGCANQCSQEACLSSSAHANVSGTANYGPSHGCQSYETQCPHPTCIVTKRAEDLATLVAASVPRNEEDLAEILLDDSVELNRERNALQFLGCDGDVVAQVPIDPDLIAQFSSRHP